jgi:hypothetical protein
MLSIPLKCAFLTSQIVRVLTLRSDPNLQAFQLLKTFVDDYVTIVATRHAVFVISDPIEGQYDSVSPPLEEYNSGLTVDVPRLGTGYHALPDRLNGTYVDPSLLHGDQKVGFPNMNHNLSYT